MKLHTWLAACFSWTAWRCTLLKDLSASKIIFFHEMIPRFGLLMTHLVPWLNPNLKKSSFGSFFKPLAKIGF